MAHRFETDPDYVTSRNAAVNALDLHYALAVCVVAALLAVVSLADSGADAIGSSAPVVETAASPATNLYGSLACERGAQQPSS
jgi:hypothetical protein